MGEGLTREAFFKDAIRIAAAERNFEVIGEAVKSIDPSFCENHPEIPWVELRGMRNWIAHQYWEVNKKTLWDTIHYDIPNLKNQVDLLLTMLQDNG